MKQLSGLACSNMMILVQWRLPFLLSSSEFNEVLIWKNFDMIIALGGSLPDSGDEQVWLLPADVTDRPAISGTLTKQQREDLQLLSFQLAITMQFDPCHPVEILRGADPPDRIFRIGDVEHSVELTESTFSDIRGEFARARYLGRQLEDYLQNNYQKFQHLTGRHVGVSILDMANLGRNDGQLIEQLGRLLEEDRGFVGEDLKDKSEFPGEWTSDRGFYGRLGDINVIVHRGQAQDRILVSSLTQAEIRLSETIALLQSRISEKDVEANEVLLITTGLPDGRGYVCGPDSAVFEFIRQSAGNLAFTPKHLKAVVIHNWGTSDWLYLFQNQSGRSCWPTKVPD